MNNINNTTDAQAINNELDELKVEKSNFEKVRQEVGYLVCEGLKKLNVGDKTMSAEQVEDLISSFRADLVADKLAEYTAIRTEQRILLNPTSLHWWGDKVVDAAVGVGAAMLGAYAYSKVMSAGQKVSDPLATTNDANASPFADNSFVATPRPSRKAGHDNVVPFDRKAS
jgi:hypothetical protein